MSKAYVQSRRSKKVALENVNIGLSRGSTLALVGKSGSGKSTLGRCLALLEKPDAGEIRIQGVATRDLRQSELRRARQRVQLIWQHTALALNPRFRVVDLIAEPLRIQGMESNRRQELTLKMMAKLELTPAVASRTPLELSGGQRQRVAIARALIQDPEIIIFDEALAGLDMPLQRQIANMLMELKVSLRLSYVFISHDLRMAASVADGIAVMHEGMIVESQPVRTLLFQPQSDATRELLDSIPASPI